LSDQPIRGHTATEFEPPGRGRVGPVSAIGLLAPRVVGWG